MNSSLLGTNISHNEITSIETTGFWLLVDGAEYFVPFEDYPIFKPATLQQIFAVKRVSPTQFRWDDLDADLELEALQQPEHYPLKWK